LSQRQPEANLSRQLAKEDITTMIDMARGKMSAVTTSMAPSKWLLFKEARGARGGSQKRKGDKFSKDKYTIKVMLDQPCKFHSVSGKPAAHTTRQCSFTRDLEQGNHQLPGPPPGLLAEAQGNKNWQPVKAAGDYPEEANVEQYHVFTSQTEDPKDEPWFGVEVNAVIQVGPQYMHWSDASITWGVKTIRHSCRDLGAMR
jgi:hypothetical protein